MLHPCKGSQGVKERQLQRRLAQGGGEDAKPKEKAQREAVIRAFARDSEFGLVSSPSL